MAATPLTLEPPSRTRLGRIFHDTLSSYLRGLPAGSRRFWLLVPLTGLIAGLGAVGSVEILKLVQRLAWGRDNLLVGALAASPLRRVLVPLSGGVMIVLSGFFFKDPPKGHGTSSLIEAIWVRRGSV